jgi:aspartate 1-decarboxylase
MLVFLLVEIINNGCHTLGCLDNPLFKKVPILAGRLGVQRFMLRSKIHRATLTGTDLDYEGSIAMDRALMDAADILPGEQVHVLNLYNGERLITYAIEAPAGSGTMLLNGPAARLGSPGDIVVVLSYCAVSDEEARKFKPVVVHVDAKNRIVS